MAPCTTELDLAGLRLASGEGRRLELEVHVDPIVLAGERYVAGGGRLTVTLDVSRMVGHGYALRLRFQAPLAGPCMRCLKEAAPLVEVDAREVDRAGGGEQLDSPYIGGDVLDLAAWAHDSLVLSLPSKVLCRPDCAGLCPQCAVDLNDAGPDHHHERAIDPRWSKLSELEL